MLPFGVTIQSTVPQRSEILEGLMNYPVYGGSGVHYMLFTTKEAASRQNTADHQQRFCCCGNHNSHIQISTQVIGNINKEVSF
jgi:hypothetical protein